jgi:hypothetical protein
MTPSPSAPAVAHVGYTGTDADRDRWVAARAWLSRVDPALSTQLEEARIQGLLREDHLDLRGVPPRDFLAEDGRYDVVLTHFLWGDPDFAGRDPSGPTACSPLHTPDAWRRRLALSGARYVFMFGPHFNGASLDHSIPGYTPHEVTTRSSLTVFASPDRGAPAEVPDLELRFEDLAEARLARLGELGDNHHLDLSESEVSGEHVEQIAAMKRLTSLSLAATRITDGDLARLCATLDLTRLDLDGTGVGPAGLAHVGRLARLRCLSLNDTRVDDTGLAHLRGLGDLEWLSLVGTAVGDRGIEVLAALDNLKYVSLVGTRASAGAVAALARALPACDINFDTGDVHA